MDVSEPIEQERIRAEIREAELKLMEIDEELQTPKKELDGRRTAT